MVFASPDKSPHCADVHLQRTHCIFPENNNENFDIILVLQYKDVGKKLESHSGDFNSLLEFKKAYTSLFNKF